MVDKQIIARISKPVTSILSNHWNVLVQVEMSHICGKPGTRNFIYRARLNAPSSAVPGSVAIKISGEEHGDIWDEWAALQFLNETSAAG